MNVLGHLYPVNGVWKYTKGGITVVVPKHLSLKEILALI